MRKLSGCFCDTRETRVAQECLQSVTRSVTSSPRRESCLLSGGGTIVHTGPQSHSVLFVAGENLQGVQTLANSNNILFILTVSHTSYMIQSHCGYGLYVV